MSGYDGWTMERFTFSDAIPLLADGVKWLGYLPNKHLLWNVGWFTDWLSEGQSFSTYDNQVTVRAAWVPMVSDSVGTLLHIGISARKGKLNEGQLQLRSRPEASDAPYFLDTGKFPASHARNGGTGGVLPARPVAVFLGVLRPEGGCTRHERSALSRRRRRCRSG